MRMVTMMEVEEFQWNLKRLLREGFPEGIPLEGLSTTYNHWLGKEVQPKSIGTGFKNWKIVFRANDLLKDTFKITSDEIPMVKLRKSGNERSSEELKEVLVLVKYANVVMMRAMQSYSVDDSSNVGNEDTTAETTASVATGITNNGTMRNGNDNDFKQSRYTKPEESLVTLSSDGKVSYEGFEKKRKKMKKQKTMATALPTMIIATPPPSNLAVPLQEQSTVSLVAASIALGPPPPSTIMTAFVPKLHPNTNVATTQFRVSMPKTMSDELVPVRLIKFSWGSKYTKDEDMNPAPQLPPSVVHRPNVRINMGNPTPTPPTPAPNPFNHINIVHRSNGNMTYTRKNGNIFTNLNQQKQMSSQGSRKSLPSPPTNDVDNSTSPEDEIEIERPTCLNQFNNILAILQIESLTSDGGPKRAGGAVSHFSTTEVRSLRIGSYKPNMPKNITRNLVTFSEFGILFNTPHAKSEVIVKCGIPADQILSIHAHFPNRLPLLAITTTLRYASWLREILGMNYRPSGPNFYCPSRGGPSEKFLILVMGDNLQAMDVGVIKRIYKRCIIDIDFSKANSLLVSTVEEKTHSQLVSTPVVVEPQPGSSKSVIKNTKRPHIGDDSGPKTKTPCHSN